MTCTLSSDQLINFFVKSLHIDYALHFFVTAIVTVNFTIFVFLTTALNRATTLTDYHDLFFLILVLDKTINLGTIGLNFKCPFVWSFCFISLCFLVFIIFFFIFIFVLLRIINDQLLISLFLLLFV